MKKLLLALVLSLLTLPAYAQQGIRSHNFTAVSSDSAINLINTSTAWHQLVWNTSGTISACTVALDTSPDGITWTAGGAIAGQTCTLNGASAVVNIIANYVRINMTALTVSAGGFVNITWDGWTSGPGGATIGGSIAPTQVGVGAGTDTISGSTGLTYNNGLVVRTTSGTGLTLHDTAEVANSKFMVTRASDGGTYIDNVIGGIFLQNLYMFADGTMTLTADGINGTQLLFDPTAGFAKFLDGSLNTAFTINTGTSRGVSSPRYSTDTNCLSSASPAVCVAAPAGSILIPTGVTSSTLVVNTTAVTANSQIFFYPDDSLGTRLSVTCNSTLATLAGGSFISARNPGVSFTITFNGTIATNGVCGSYHIIN